MARQTKEAKIKELEQSLKDTQDLLRQISKRNAEMTEQAEKSFLNSPTYNQMLQKIDFYKTLYDLGEMHLATAKKQTMRVNDHFLQVFADNKRMCEHEGDTFYWTGITENWHTAKEYEKLQEEIRKLSGKIEQQTLTIANLNDEIDALQLVIASDEDKTYRRIAEEQCRQLEIELALEKDKVQQLESDLRALKKPANAPTTSLSQEAEQLQEEVMPSKEQLQISEQQLSASTSSPEYMRSKNIERIIEQPVATTVREVEELQSDTKALIETAIAPTTSQSIEVEQLQKENTRLKDQIQELEKQLSETVSSLENVSSKNIEQKNATKAKEVGRPQKVDEDQTTQILKLREQGLPMRNIATQMNLSVGTVHRIIHLKN